MTEDEVVRWHHQLNAHEFEQTLGYSEGQGSLACCSPWVRKELTATTMICKAVASRKVNRGGNMKVMVLKMANQSPITRVIF